MIDIIEELSKERINLQEIILNLENQGYAGYWDFWVWAIYQEALWKQSLEITKLLLRKERLI